MKEQTILKWQPIDHIPEQLYLECFCDDYNGLTIDLKGKNEFDKILQISFSSHLGYRNVDESYRLQTLNLYPILKSSWPLFTSVNADFTKWIFLESSGILETLSDYMNYIICTPNDILEVVSNQKPLVQWL